jgi:hypothetical protein
MFTTIPYAVQHDSSLHHPILFIFNTLFYIILLSTPRDRLCGLVVRALGYRSGGPGSIPGTTRKKM